VLFMANGSGARQLEFKVGQLGFGIILNGRSGSTVVSFRTKFKLNTHLNFEALHKCVDHCALKWS